jgi:hypothetical protein
VPASEGGLCCLSLVGPGICWRVGGTRDSPVQVLFPQGWERFESGSSGWPWVLGVDAVGGPPQGWERFESGSSGWPWVLGVDAVGGPPHGYVADECGARVAARWSPRTAAADERATRPPPLAIRSAIRAATPSALQRAALCDQLNGLVWGRSRCAHVSCGQRHRRPGKGEVAEPAMLTA